MKLTELLAFSALLTKTMKVYGKELPADMHEFWFDILRHYELPDIARALSAHLSDPEHGQFPPKPADVIKRLTPVTTHWEHRRYERLEQKALQRLAAPKASYDKARPYLQTLRERLKPTVKPIVEQRPDDAL